MRKFTITINGKEYKVSVKRVTRTLYKVRLGDKVTEVSIREDKVAIVKPKVQEEKKEVKVVEGQAVTAMLPGVVARILVKEGDKVKAGDPILILEAMKMENEVTSPKEGVVKQIVVKEGDRVEAGDLLAVID
jgi:biotin carboxyl carrier protein